jgi:hypothetical protein
MEKLNFTSAEKAALRAVFIGESITSAAEANGLSDHAVESAFERFQRAMLEAEARPFIDQVLASSAPQDVYWKVMERLGVQKWEDFNDTAPNYQEKQAEKREKGRQDVFQKIKERVGWQSWDDFNDTAPDYQEKQAEKCEKGRQDSQEYPVWKSLFEKRATQVMADLGWQSYEDFEVTSAAFLKHQHLKHTKAGQPVVPDISDALAQSRAITAQVVEEFKTKNPAIIANDEWWIQLENFAFDLSDIIEGMPFEQRRPFVDSAMADWLAHNTEAARRATEVNDEQNSGR